ncbi:hypothetical protein EV421DRAFT_1855423 [Armillaria borealis]|uniref:Uncharacterized protein n=1 Tax=Armillaria borealis TaxID=47425 RepID=A0AA39IWE5_9AGAR|nr:hypothetical protein EV421DRAFT_1855423 [Armillaria borealis]
MVAWKRRIFPIYFNKALMVAAYSIMLRIDAAPLPISFIPARRLWYLGHSKMNSLLHFYSFGKTLTFEAAHKATKKHPSLSSTGSGTAR